MDINCASLDELRERDTENGFFENGYLKAFIKQSIGAFWGMVFRFALGYEDKRRENLIID